MPTFLLFLLLAALPRPRVATPAPWVEPLRAEAPAADREEAVRHGLHELLSDEQVRVEGAEVERYVHRAIHILSPGGVEAASQVRIEFEPSY